MEKEKQLAQRLKQFLARYYYSQENEDENVIQEENVKVNEKSHSAIKEKVKKSEKKDRLIQENNKTQEKKVSHLSNLLQKNIKDVEKKKKSAGIKQISKTPEKPYKKEFFSEKKPRKAKETTNSKILLTIKNSDNLQHYGLDSKKLDKLSKSSYKKNNEKSPHEKIPNTSNNHSISPEKTNIKEFDKREDAEKELFKESNEKIKQMKEGTIHVPSDFK